MDISFLFVNHDHIMSVELNLIYTQKTSMKNKYKNIFEEKFKLQGKNVKIYLKYMM